MPTTPQDRKSTADVRNYTFEATVRDKDGKPRKRTFSLPSAADAAANVPGRFLRNAALNGDEGEIALGFATLEAAGAKQEALDALYDLPSAEMLEHIQAWMSFKAEPKDASLGESSGSSD